MTDLSFVYEVRPVIMLIHLCTFTKFFPKKSVITKPVISNNYRDNQNSGLANHSVDWQERATLVESTFYAKQIEETSGSSVDTVLVVDSDTKKRSIRNWCVFYRMVRIMKFDFWQLHELFIMVKVVIRLVGSPCKADVFKYK